MNLGQRQRLFGKLAPLLMMEIHSRGFEYTFGEAYRTPEQALIYAKQGRGIARSLHQIKCAIDLNLFKDGVYLETTEAHRQFGEFWESLHPNCRWGGRYNDGNHYEFLEKPRTP